MTKQKSKEKGASMINSIQQFQTEVSKLTSLGEGTYKKTYFHNPQTGERCCLLDRLMGFGRGERLTEDAIARIYEEVADSSYRKGGMNASISGMPLAKR